MANKKLPTLCQTLAHLHLHLCRRCPLHQPLLPRPLVWLRHPSSSFPSPDIQTPSTARLDPMPIRYRATNHPSLHHHPPCWISRFTSHVPLAAVPLHPYDRLLVPHNVMPLLLPRIGVWYPDVLQSLRTSYGRNIAQSRKVFLFIFFSKCVIEFSYTFGSGML